MSCADQTHQPGCDCGSRPILKRPADTEIHDRALPQVEDQQGHQLQKYDAGATRLWMEDGKAYLCGWFSLSELLIILKDMGIQQAQNEMQKRSRK